METVYRGVKIATCHEPLPPPRPHTCTCRHYIEKRTYTYICVHSLGRFQRRDSQQRFQRATFRDPPPAHTHVHHMYLYMYAHKASVEFYVKTVNRGVKRATCHDPPPPTLMYITCIYICMHTKPR